MADIFTKAKELWPNATDDEITRGINEIRAKDPNITDDQIIQVAQGVKQKMDDGSFYKTAATEQVRQKFFGDQFSDEARAKLAQQAQTEKDGQRKWEALAALGAGIAGRDPMSVRGAFDARRKEIDDKFTGDFDRKRQKILQDFDINQKFTQAERADKTYKEQEELKLREQDPSSEESKLAQNLAAKMLPSKDFSGMSAAQINKLLPSIQKFYDVEQRKIDRADAREQRNFERERARNEKMDKYREERDTQFGLARTADDAKKIKEAGELKANFDRKLDEMIQLRKDYGGELYNREAVGRGKQLSKDLLLLYKDMAKLGVLSVSDEAILNEIIPSDPLQYNVSGLVGQDPTMVKLEKFKSDANKDFETRLQNRLKDPAPPKEEKKEAPPKAKEVERKTKDGRIAIFDAETKEFLRYK